MATTTTNFGWDIPQSTDLVKDGATAIAALGQDIDTAFIDLKGGTTGQILSKASGTDLDFTWATAGGGGKVLQVVQGETSTKTTVASSTYTDSALTATITPSSASSKVLVLVSQNLFLSRLAAESYGFTQLLRGSTSIYDNDFIYLAFNAAVTSIYRAANYPITYLDSPATTSATTYKTQIKVENTGNSAQIIAQDRGPSTIILMEIGA